MRRLLTCLAAFAVLPAISHAEELTIERLVASPSLNGPSVGGIRISPDGTKVTFLKGKQENFRQRDLWAYDVATGETALLVDSDVLLGGKAEQLDEVEKARRERLRISGSGIVQYQFSKDGQALLFPLGGDLYYLPLGGEPKRLTTTPETETDAKLSPEGNYVSYIRAQNLYVYDLATDTERAITSDGGGTILNGMAEFVAQEEIGRSTGYWWSPDESKIAYARVDESPVKLVNRYEVGADGEVTSIEQRYPFAGTNNVLISLHIASVTAPDAAHRPVDLGAGTNIYVTQVHWHPDSTHFLVRRQNRAQQKMDLLAYNLTDNWRKILLTETSETWLNVQDGGLRFIEDGQAFLWKSERDGFAHVYRYDWDGGAPKQLTKGEWVVTGINAVDEEAGALYLTATKDNVLERHLYRVPLKGRRSIKKVTQGEGWHRTVVSPKADVFIDFFNSPDQPPEAVIRNLDGKKLAELSPNPLDDSHPYAPYLDGHAASDFGTLTAADGQDLYYSLTKPADFDPDKTYPAIVSVYGGPGVQRVSKTWSIGFDQILARNGFVVLKLDNRGSYNRGKAFEDPIFRHMGEVEVEDQLVGVEYLKSLGFVDEARIGVHGWSYGGYMTLMLLAKAPDVFKAGLSVAPVSDWSLYDTHYTERFLGKPQDGDAYDKSNLFAYIDGIEDNALLLVHGMADDNVFFDHSVKVMGALQNARVDFDLMTYPGKRHGIRGEATRAHLWTKALDFFNTRLQAE